MATALDQEWRRFIEQQHNFYDESMQSQLTTIQEPLQEDAAKPPETDGDSPKAPPCGPLVISTKTKCLYLNAPIPIYDVFWRVPTLPYWRPENGVVKKQTKIICASPEEYEEYKAKLQAMDPAIYEEKVIKFVDNAGYVPSDQDAENAAETPAEPLETPSVRPYKQVLSKTAANRRKLKYKNERKLTVGMCKKDVLNVRRKEKQGAFYNCVALTLRIKYEGVFDEGQSEEEEGRSGVKTHYYEFHAKIFNTGKIEVPGRMNSEMMELIKAEIIRILSAVVPFAEPLAYVSCKRGVLINSGFRCGFYIDRDKVHDILKTKYGIETSYDSCSYQGVKSKYYFNHELGFDANKQTGRILEGDASRMKDLNMNKKYSEVAFMIFRTGSCIIVGNCSKRVLYFIYEVIKTILAKEFARISLGIEEPQQIKKKKARKVSIACTEEYVEEHIH